MHQAFLVPSCDSSLLITMADASVINPVGAIVVEKRGRGCPRGSKNKPNTSTAASSSTTMAKHRLGHPLGSKNKKLSAAMASAADHLDVSLAQPSLPQS
jgi:hypothetical protein